MDKKAVHGNMRGYGADAAVLEGCYAEVLKWIKFLNKYILSDIK